MTSRKINLPKITAELKQWQLNDEQNVVEGYIFNSISKEYKDGEYFILRPFLYMVHYPEYHLVRTQTGLYFKLLKGDEKSPE